MINVEEYNLESHSGDDIKVERPDSPHFIVNDVITDTYDVIDSSHEIDNIETIELDESNETEEIEASFQTEKSDFRFRILNKF